MTSSFPRFTLLLARLLLALGSYTLLSAAAPSSSASIFHVDPPAPVPFLAQSHSISHRSILYIQAGLVFAVLLLVRIFSKEGAVGGSPSWLCIGKQEVGREEQEKLDARRTPFARGRATFINIRKAVKD